MYFELTKRVEKHCVRVGLMPAPTVRGTIPIAFQMKWSLNQGSAERGERTGEGPAEEQEVDDDELLVEARVQSKSITISADLATNGPPPRAACTPSRCGGALKGDVAVGDGISVKLVADAGKVPREIFPKDTKLWREIKLVDTWGDRIVGAEVRKGRANIWHTYCPKNKKQQCINFSIFCDNESCFSAEKTRWKHQVRGNDNGWTSGNDNA
ncbi:hypothetical protein B0H17DRAFT_1147935 [Mycena rosella]|uniref:Uncharacterized protein n=1 Tax=Mycena rosella TaxID=1033263 RepID=A0AAD7CJA1_MYCRO|nr:hypothetical protein B0H17DRAFT_1147935 [Mycena rosella]